MLIFNSFSAEKFSSKWPIFLNWKIKLKNVPISAKKSRYETSGILSFKKYAISTSLRADLTQKEWSYVVDHKNDFWSTHSELSFEYRLDPVRPLER